MNNSRKPTVTVHANSNQETQNDHPGESSAKDSLAIKSKQLTLDDVLGSIQPLPNEAPDQRQDIEMAVSEAMAEKIRRERQTDIPAVESSR